jgi:hypothetical protein
MSSLSLYRTIFPTGKPYNYYGVKHPLSISPASGEYRNVKKITKFCSKERKRNLNEQKYKRQNSLF